MALAPGIEVALINGLGGSATPDYSLKKIEEIQAYRLNVKNVWYISNHLLDMPIQYGELLSKVYESPFMEATRKNIEHHFVDFVKLYINENVDNEFYFNDEDILLKIINSNLDIEYKQKYASLNTITITDLGGITDIEEDITVIETLFAGKNVLYISNNIQMYLDSVDHYSTNFVEYMDENLENPNSKAIYSEIKELSQRFINDNNISDKLFNNAIMFARDKNSIINSELNNSRIHQMACNNLIAITDHNINVLLDKNLDEDIVMLFESQEEDQQNKAVEILLKHSIEKRLIYMLINSNISDENSIKLVSTIEGEISLNEINLNNVTVIQYLIESRLSTRNVNYICSNFNKFPLKDEFIECLEDNSRFSEIEDNSLTPKFMQTVFNSDKVSTDSKIDIIITRINNHAKEEDLFDLISSVDEISELSTLLDGRRPKLDNSYKIRVGNALILAGYVTKREDPDCNRIVLKKS